MYTSKWTWPPEAILLKLQFANESPGDLVKNADSESVGLGWGSDSQVMQMLLVHRPHLGVAKAEGELFSNIITPSLKDSK